MRSTCTSEATFDTMKAGSDALAVYLNGIEDGTMVLIGARDEAPGIFSRFLTYGVGRVGRGIVGDMLRDMEASINLTDTAKTAIKTCGATMIDSKALSDTVASSPVLWSSLICLASAVQNIGGLGFRGGYALVGIKGGAALAEDLKKTTEGYAVAVAQMKAGLSSHASAVRVQVQHGPP